MLKTVFAVVAVLCVSPVLLIAAPASIYGKALQRARNVSSQAERSRALPPEPAQKPAQKTAPEAAQKAAQKAAADRMAFARKFASSIVPLKRYPVSGAAGINVMLKKKILPPRFFGQEIKMPVTEKKLPVAWFGTEANRAKNKGVFPLFVTKPAFGPVIAGFTDGNVIQLKQRPRTVTGVIHILRSTSKYKKSSLWNSYQKTAGAIDKASK